MLARIRRGLIEAQEPIPSEWEGRLVTVVAAPVNDEGAELEHWFAEMRELGPAEFEPGEREMIGRSLAESDAVSLAAMRALGGQQP